MFAAHFDVFILRARSHFNLHVFNPPSNYQLSLHTRHLAPQCVSQLSQSLLSAPSPPHRTSTQFSTALVVSSHPPWETPIPYSPPSLAKSHSFLEMYSRKRAKSNLMRPRSEHPSLRLWPALPALLR